MIIVVMGPQGSGKSTQAKLLAEYLGWPHVSTGDLFRGLKDQPSELAQRIAGQLDQGFLVSDADVMLVLQEELAQPQYRKGLIVDGFPRNRWQAEHAPFQVDRVFYLKVGDPENVKRLLARGRADDTEELIKQRLTDYHQLTEPVLDFYRAKGVLVEIDGERAIEPIFEDIKSHLA